MAWWYMSQSLWLAQVVQREFVMGPRQKQYLSLEEGYDEADFDAPMLDAED